MKGDKVIPSKKEEVRAYATMLKDRAQLMIKHLLFDLRYDKDLVDYILAGDKEGGIDGNGVNIVDDRDRDDISTSKRDCGDIEEDVLC